MPHGLHAKVYYPGPSSPTQTLGSYLDNLPDSPQVPNYFQMCHTLSISLNIIYGHETLYNLVYVLLRTRLHHPPTARAPPRGGMHRPS
jgi:hypothetical protein